VSRLSRVLSAVALVALAGGPLSMAPAFAQSAPASPTAPTTTTQVSGTVTDPTGAPIAGATITLRGAQTYTATSDAQGRYAIPAAPGVYTATVTRTGFQSGTEQDVAVTAGTPVNLNVQLVTPTLSTLRVIGSTRTSFSRSTFNTSPASVSVINTQTFVDQGQPQVKNVLNQTPGLVVSLPATSGNGAAPGAITFPNIRGGLSFETASLIDGHPVSVGAFGDYVSTFLNSFLLQSVEVIKGPGAAAPEVNYAIGGTVNFRTLDPSRTPTGYETVGVDSFGGTFSNFGYSNTVAKGKLGFVVDYAVTGTNGPLDNFTSYTAVNNGWLINGQPLATAVTKNGPIPGTSQTYFNQSTSLVYAGLPTSSWYTGKSELAKLRYNFSNATTFTASYLGSQTNTEQNGNHMYLEQTAFNPAASYNSVTGPAAGFVQGQDNVFPPAHEYEINNEPIFQGELRTTLGTNNILARAYSASISRLQYNGLSNTTQPGFVPTQLYGTASVCPVALVKAACPVAPVTRTYTGQQAVLTVPAPGAYFNDSEEDRLHGYSLEVDHPFGDTGNLFSLAFDTVDSVTGKYSTATYVPGGSVTATVPPTSGQTFTTLLARYIGNVGPRAQITLSNYFNNYDTHYSQTNGATFTDQHNSHYDARLGATYRLSPDASLRFSLGSAIAPPYIGLYSRVTTVPLIDRSGNFATNTEANPAIRPETSFGYNFGGDVRLGPDKQTVFSGDVYYTNLFNQLISTSQYANGNVTVPSFLPSDAAGKPTGPLVTVPLTSTGSTNLAKARYEGIELSLRRDPAFGFGYTVQGALQKAMPIDVPRSFYTNPGSNVPVRNLGVISGVNFYGGSQGVSNQSIPYSQGYGEVRFRSRNGGLLSFGETYYGPNNSLFQPAFFIANANARLSLSHGYALNLNIDNVFNTFGNDYITEYGGQFQPYITGASTTAGAPLAGAQLNANTYGPRDVRLSLSKRIGG
jgi:outer membrane receptor protein involved in Fe transport